MQALDVRAFQGGTDEEIRTGNPLTAVQKVELAFRHYLQLRGRASRSEFWWFFLATIAVSVVAEGLDASLGMSWGFGALATLLTFIPSITVGVRRLHDIDRTGWWMLATISMIGIFLLIFWFIQRGDSQPNRFNTIG